MTDRVAHSGSTWNYCLGRFFVVNARRAMQMNAIQSPRMLIWSSTLSMSVRMSRDLVLAVVQAAQQKPTTLPSNNKAHYVSNVWKLCVLLRSPAQFIRLFKCNHMPFSSIPIVRSHWGRFFYITFCPFIQPIGCAVRMDTSNINGDHGRHSLYRSIFPKKKINIVDWTGPPNNAVEPQQINKQAKWPSMFDQCEQNTPLNGELDVRTRPLCGQLKMKKKTRAHNNKKTLERIVHHIMWNSFSYKIWINKYYEHCIISSGDAFRWKGKPARFFSWSGKLFGPF